VQCYLEYQRRVAFLVEEILGDDNGCVCRLVVEDLAVGALIESAFNRRETADFAAHLVALRIDCAKAAKFFACKCGERFNG
jgi:hypothetical protein